MESIRQPAREPVDQLKTCGICGRDCSGQKRVRDPKGSYYCRSCYESAVARRQVRKAAGETDLHPDLSASADLLAELAGQTGSMSAHGSVICPGCRNIIDAEAILCTNCGFHLRSGRQARTVRVEQRRPTEPGAERWPAPVGMVSVGLGVVGAAWHVTTLVLAMLVVIRDVSAMGVIEDLVRGAVCAFLSLWLVAAGVGMMRRRRASDPSIRGWAALTAAVAILAHLGVGCLLLLGVITPAAASELMGWSRLELGETTLLAALVASLFLVLAWPVFVSSWFNRDDVRKQVVRWA